MSIVTINRVATWVRRALDMKGPGAGGVGEVDTGPAKGIWDVFQGGWYDLEWTYVEIDQPASTASQKLDVLEADLELGVIMLAASVTHNGGAAAGQVIMSSNNASGVAGNVPWGQCQIQVGEFATLGFNLNPTFQPNSFGVQPPVIYPPGIAPSWIFPATGVGEDYDSRCLVAQYRKGFKPL